MAYQCKIDSMVLDLIDISDEWKGALVRHHYAGRDGADLEWMGWDSTEHRLRAVFSGAGTEDADFSNSYANHGDFLAMLRQNDEMPLVHPVYGEVRGRVADLSIKHEDVTEFIQIDFTFVEQGLDKPISLVLKAQDVVSELTKKALGDLSKSFPPLGPDALAVECEVDFEDPNWQDKLTSAFAAFSNKIQTAVAAVAGQLGRIDAIGSAIGAAASSLAGATEFSKNLPGQISAQVHGMLDKMAELAKAIEGDPIAASGLVYEQMAVQTATFAGTEIAKFVRLLAALQMLRTVADALALDEDSLNASKAYEAQQGFDSSGRWLARTSAPESYPANATHVGRMVANARALVQQSIALADDPQPYMEMALAVEMQFRERLLQLEQIREIEVLDPTPLHLLCVRNGLPYNAAERIARLNNFRNPSFVQGKVLIYAR